MKKMILITVLMISVMSSFAQFKKITRTEKIGTFDLGNYYLYRHSSGNDIEMILYIHLH